MEFRHQPHLIAAITGLALTLAVVECPAATPPTNAASQLRWQDARALRVEGKGWQDTKDFYDRLPARAEMLVRPAVWNLSRDSAGLCVRFVTDATTIAARWKLRKESLAMPHMPATGVSGLDLYVRGGNRWHWLANGRPTKGEEEKVLATGLEPARREYRLYLPLYNGVTEVAIGVPEGSELTSAAPGNEGEKPIVFYGTSIVQGGCASRPGMAYPAILGRWLDRPTVNLGFSGNAHGEPEVAQLLAELDPAVYVLDPLPNMSAPMITERYEGFVRALRAAHPVTPIVMVENLDYADSGFVSKRREHTAASNGQLREIYRRLVKAGDRRLFYVTGKALIGTDGEGTVDGAHPTDLGFWRMAKALEPELKRALKKNR